MDSFVSPAPLILSDDGAQLSPATALCELFRTDFPADAKARLAGRRPVGNPDVIERISAIHRQIAALHENSPT